MVCNPCGRDIDLSDEQPLKTSDPILVIVFGNSMSISDEQPSYVSLGKAVIALGSLTFSRLVQPENNDVPIDAILSGRDTSFSDVQFRKA